VFYLVGRKDLPSVDFSFIPLAPFAFAIPSAQRGLDSFLKHVFSTKIIFFKTITSPFEGGFSLGWCSATNRKEFYLVGRKDQPSVEPTCF
jgi:hypothetical protein